MYEFVRFYVCSFELQFLMPYEDSDNPNSIFYVFGVYYIYIPSTKLTYPSIGKGKRHLPNCHMCWSLNSHYFNVIGHGYQANSVGVHIPVIRISYQSWVDHPLSSKESVGTNILYPLVKGQLGLPLTMYPSYLAGVLYIGILGNCFTHKYPLGFF